VVVEKRSCTGVQRASQQCLDRRTPDIESLARLVDAWETTRNQVSAPIL
jgi:hypothetical protein